MLTCIFCDSSKLVAYQNGRLTSLQAIEETKQYCQPVYVMKESVGEQKNRHV